MMNEREQIRKNNKVSTFSASAANKRKLLNRSLNPLVKQSPLIQTKLTISQPGDKYEQEADRVADQIMHMQDGDILQYKCTNCKNMDENVLHPKESSEQLPASQDRHILPFVNEVLHSPGQPLDSETRAFMEPRFGYDFSKVRVHTDMKAVDSAWAINALAYTTGVHLVFGPEQYTPHTFAGKRLIAHELVHTIQQDSVARLFNVSSKNLIIPNNYSSKQTIPNRNIIQRTYYNRNELKEYLSYLKQNNKIEGKIDSDDKAVALVQWSENTNAPFFNLNPKIKSLLIKEMLMGFTGDDEEEAILDLLERANNKELIYILTEGGITVDELEHNFHGKEFEWLTQFFERRFEGGWFASSKGQLKVKGKPIPRNLSLKSLFPERLDGKSGEYRKAKIRKYITLIDVRFSEVRPISSIVWMLGEAAIKRRFVPLTKKGEYNFDAGTARIVYNTKEEETIEVTGGAQHPKFQTHRTGQQSISIKSKAGASYVNRYDEPMPYAAFFYRGQAFHGCGNRNWVKNIFAPTFCLNIPSHGCIHVKNSIIERIYPFILIGKTKVRIR